MRTESLDLLDAPFGLRQFPMEIEVICFGGRVALRVRNEFLDKNGEDFRVFPSSLVIWLPALHRGYFLVELVTL